MQVPWWDLEMEATGLERSLQVAGNSEYDRLPGRPACTGTGAGTAARGAQTALPLPYIQLLPCKAGCWRLTFHMPVGLISLDVPQELCFGSSASSTVPREAPWQGVGQGNE